MFPLPAKRTSVPVLLCEALPRLRTIAEFAGFRVDCISVHVVSPSENRKMTAGPLNLILEEAGRANLGHDCGSISISLGWSLRGAALLATQ